MGSGSTAYRQAMGEYQALQEHLRATGEISLEQQQQQLEFDLKTYELQKAGKLPSLTPIPNSSDPVSQPVYVTPIAKAEPAFDIKKFMPVAVIGGIAYYLSRKK